MDNKGYIGIDFGTANSHFAYCEIEEGSINAKVIPLDGAENNASVPSYLLWQLSENSKRTPKAYGARAIEEWMLEEDLNEGGVGRYILTGAFKPDLVSSSMSRQSAREFLAFARRNMVATRTPRGIGDELSWPVVIGVPAKISSEHRARTEEVAKDAGFHQVSCLEEPLGAVGYHLAYKQIDYEDLDCGLVVIDFGGGTLDIATVDRDGVKEPWGEPRLGGRLLDDLFFQWVVDASRVDLKDFDKAELLAIWWMNCRRLKENFSKYWASKVETGNADFTGFKGRVETRDGGTFGVLRGVGLGEFQERARAYRPSDLARDYFENINSDLQHLGKSQPIDLLDWVKSTIARGPDQSGSRGYGTVILTGGSSSWPFMQPMIREVFGNCEVLVPNAPECTIGQGLAMYNVLRKRYDSQKDRAIADVHSLKSNLDEVVRKEIEQAAEEIAEEIVHEIMAIARPEFCAWWDSGGQLAQVENSVSKSCKCIPASQIADQRLARLLPEIERKGTESIRIWLSRHDIKGTYDGMHLGTFVGVRDLTLTISLGDELADQVVSKAVSFVTTTIVGGLAVVIAASSVTLAASPLALIAIPVAAGIYLAKDRIKQKLVVYDFKEDALMYLQKLYSKVKLNEALQKAENECSAAIEEAVTEALGVVQTKLDQFVASAREEVLRRFGLLNRLSRLDSVSESEVAQFLTGNETECENGQDANVLDSINPVRLTS